MNISLRNMTRSENGIGEDHALWQRFIKGDDKAFASIYEIYVDSMLYYGLHFTPLRYLVKDAIQDVFVYIYDNRARLKKVDNIKVYLYVSLKHRLFALFNEEGGYLQIHNVDLLFFIEDSSEEILIGREIESESQANVKRMLQLLSPRQREIIYYRFTEGMSYDEISDLLQINYQSVRNLLHRSLLRIREVLVCSPGKENLKSRKL